MSDAPQRLRPECGRAWEVEAIEDGRLSGASAESMERHIASCAVCTRERAALAALREAASKLPETQASELDRRRLRASLLRKADEQIVGRSTPRRARAAIVFAAAAAAIVVVALRYDARRAPALAIAAPRFEIASVHDAAWRADGAGAEARPVLSSGVVEVHVHPLTPGQRFVLEVPDGEIEVHGTRFVVAVDHERTASVVVSEGVVALRLDGRAERALHAGERWDAPPNATAANANAPSAASAAPPIAASASSAPTPEAPSVAGATRRVGAPAPTRAGEGELFAGAMKAFSAGAYADADAKLGAFITEYPGDPRSEDAAFLRAVARSRMGDTAGAAAAAKAYLGAYPNGLRRQEALVIASGK